MSLATVSMIAKNMRNRRSKRYKRKDGDLIHVRKADKQGWVHYLPRENAFCLLFSVSVVCKDWVVWKGATVLRNRECFIQSDVGGW